jgi:citrate lyase subunit beta/citryl-CoA lyase
MPASLRPRRSALFIPGSNERALEKGKTVAADVLILDLEDSVSPDRKDRAREAVAAAVTGLTTGRREIVVRVNGLDTPWVARDIAAMATARPDALLVPKLSRVDDVRRARTAVAAAQAPRDMSLWAMIETPAAVLNAAAMAAIAAMPSPAITCYVIGINDLAAEMGGVIRPGRAAFVPYLAQVALAARAHGLAVLDSVFADLDDKQALAAECEQARDLGMDGKTLVHPTQVAVANALFAPSKDDVAWSRKVIEAFADPDNSGKGVIRLGGRMVERLHERVARRTLELAGAIEAMGSEEQDRGPETLPP